MTGTPYGEIPDFVLANAEKRLSAHRRIRTCIGPDCNELATHSNCNGQDRCETHRLTPPPPIPDPTRTLAALKARARAQRLLTEEDQLLTVRIRYTWASQIAKETAA